jgi:hypothetical protein
MENKSYDLQYKNMQANRSRIPMDNENQNLLSTQRQILATSSDRSPEKVASAGIQDSIAKTGMLSDYFARSDAKIDTQKQAKYSVYLQTQKVNGNILRSSRGKLSAGKLSNRKGVKGPTKMDE